MLAVLKESQAADQVEISDTLQSLADSYAHLVNCDLHLDMLFVEVDGGVIGYGRLFWQEVPGIVRLYVHEGFLLPAWRGRGIGRFLLAYNELRLRQIASGHPQDLPRFFQVEAASAATTKIRLLERLGYTPVRYFCDMLRPDLEDIPAYPLPPGLEVRPARPEHYRLIWEADQQAMLDHWEHVPYTEEDYRYWLQGDLEFQPEIWKVAWDVQDSQVAGMVLGYILEEYNARYNCQRGWVGSISVRRPWRRRGLARALIAESLRELQRRGMQEAALSVDAENLSGALRLYESLGFVVQKRSVLYRKPLE